MNPLHLLSLSCVLVISVAERIGDSSGDFGDGQRRNAGGYGLLRPGYPNYSGGYNSGYNGYNGGYGGGFGGGYGGGYNPGFGGPGAGYPSYSGSYPGGYGGYPANVGGAYGGLYQFLVLLEKLFKYSNRPYYRPGYDGRPGYNYQSGYPGYWAGNNQYRPSFDRPYQGYSGYFGGRDGYNNFSLLGRKASEIKKDDAEAV